jgi:hypothetical protein
VGWVGEKFQKVPRPSASASLTGQRQNGVVTCEKGRSRATAPA